MQRRQEASPSAGSPGTRCTDRTARSAPTPRPETRPAGDESSDRWVILQSLTFPKSLLECSMDNHHKYFGKLFGGKQCLEPQTNVFFFFFFFFVCLFGFLTSSSRIGLYCGRTPRQSVRQFYVLPHMRLSWETMTSVSAGHIILTPT